MVKAIADIGKRVIEAGGSLVGFRRLTEEPAHTREQLPGRIELRRYQARVVAETTVVADEESARRIAFGRLAGYIFGANHGPATVARRSDGGRGEKIAMTAPVTQHAGSDGRWVIRFFMPAAKTLESLPDPDDPTVTVKTAPAETIAVRRFSGSTSPRAVAAQTKLLMRALVDQGLEATDAAEAWFYDPPWTVPFLRRNEIAVPVRRAA